jgi:hypothetical protein
MKSKLPSRWPSSMFWKREHGGHDARHRREDAVCTRVRCASFVHEPSVAVSIIIRPKAERPVAWLAAEAAELSGNEVDPKRRPATRCALYSNACSERPVDNRGRRAYAQFVVIGHDPRGSFCSVRTSLSTPAAFRYIPYLPQRSV